MKNNNIQDPMGLNYRHASSAESVDLRIIRARFLHNTGPKKRWVVSKEYLRDELKRYALNTNREIANLVAEGFLIPISEDGDYEIVEKSVNAIYNLYKNAVNAVNREMVPSRYI